MGDQGQNGHSTNGGDKHWKVRRERILFYFGLAIIIAVFVASQIPGGTFHWEFLILAAGFCGVAITQWQDKK